MSFEAAWPTFIAAVEQAYQLAKSERLAEMKGRRQRTFDDRGLHPYSEVWGYIGAATSTEIADWQSACGRGLGAISPTIIRDAARRDAAREFVHEIIETGGFA